MILLLLSVYITDYDFQPSQDKFAHAFMGYTVSSVSYSISVGFEQDNSLLTVITVSAVGAIWKEGYDYKHTGKASLGDITYTIVGGIIGAIVSSWLFRRGNE